MSTLGRAILRAYDTATHKADVQLADSLTTRLTSVPVATDIAAAECVAGRECALLMFDDNPDDAVVVTIHGATPTTAVTGSTLVISGQAAISASAVKSDALLDIGGGGTYTGKLGLHVGVGSTVGAGTGNVFGVGGYALAKTAGDTNAYGLDFVAGMSGINLTRAYGARASVLAQGTGKTLTDAYVLYAKGPTAVLATITNVYGVYVDPLNVGSTRRHPFYDAGTAASGNNRGNVFKSSTQFFKDLDLGGGSGVLGIGPATTVPSTNPSGGFVIYVDPADSKLKCRGRLGTVTILANP